MSEEAKDINTARKMRPISVNVDEAVTIDWDQIKDFFLPGSVILQAIPATSPEVVGAPTGPPMLTTLDSVDFNEIDALSSYSPEVYDISHEWSANGDTPELIMVGDLTLVSTVTNRKDQRTEENTDHTKIVVLSDTNKKRGKVAITDKTGTKDAKATYDFFNKIEAVLEFNPYRFVQGSDGNQTCWNEIVSELGKKNIVTTKRNLQVFLCNHLKEHREKFKLLSGIEEPTMSDRDRLLADIDEIKQNQKKTSKDESAKLEKEVTRRRLRVGMQPGLKITKIYEAEKSASVIEESDYVNRFKKTSKEKLISDSDLGTPTANEEGNYNFKIKRDAVLRIAQVTGRVGGTTRKRKADGEERCIDEEGVLLEDLPERLKNIKEKRNNLKSNIHDFMDKVLTDLGDSDKRQQELLCFEREEREKDRSFQLDQTKARQAEVEQEKEKIRQYQIEDQDRVRRQQIEDQKRLLKFAMQSTAQMMEQVLQKLNK